MIGFWIYLKMDFAVLPDGLNLGWEKEKTRTFTISDSAGRNVDVFMEMGRTPEGAYLRKWHHKHPI